jgi:uncharacterized RDD family membrane protein YckC
MVHCRNCGNELPEDATYCPKCGAPAQKGPELELALWGERFIAWLIDVIIIGVIIGIVRLLAWISWPGYPWVPVVPPWIPFFDFGLSNVVYFLYWMLMEGVYGQSIGKIFMGIRVARMDGNSAGLDRAALESVGKAFLLPIDLILGWVFYPRRRQRIFNYLSQTIVLRVSR